jgi:hypothetical protein
MLRLEYKSKIVTTYESLVKSYASQAANSCPTLMEAKKFIDKKIKDCEVGKRNPIKIGELYYTNFENDKLHIMYNGNNKRVVATIISIKEENSNERN